MPEFRRLAALTVVSACVVTTFATLMAAGPAVTVADRPQDDRLKSQSTERPKEAPLTSDRRAEAHPSRPEGESRFTPRAVFLPTTVPLNAQVDLNPNGGGGGIAGNCPPTVSAWTNSNFGAGSYILQLGFAEQEMAGASFTIDPSNFPIRIDVAEMIFATTGATVTGVCTGAAATAASAGCSYATAPSSEGATDGVIACRNAR